MRKVPLGDDVKPSIIARGTPGFSGADLMNLVNEAALLASRRKAEAVEMCDMEEARDKVCWGRERRSHALDDEEKHCDRNHEEHQQLDPQMRVHLDRRAGHTCVLEPRAVREDER